MPAWCAQNLIGYTCLHVYNACPWTFKWWKHRSEKICLNFIFICSIMPLKFLHMQDAPQLSLSHKFSRSGLQGSALLLNVSCLRWVHFCAKSVSIQEGDQSMIMCMQRWHCLYIHADIVCHWACQRLVDEYLTLVYNKHLSTFTCSLQGDVFTVHSTERSMLNGSCLCGTLSFLSYTDAD